MKKKTLALICVVLFYFLLFPLSSDSSTECSISAERSSRGEIGFSVWNNMRSAGHSTSNNQLDISWPLEQHTIGEQAAKSDRSEWSRYGGSHRLRCHEWSGSTGCRWCWSSRFVYVSFVQCSHFSNWFIRTICIPQFHRRSKPSLVWCTQKCY